jgi:hypothetical protein
MTPNTDGMLYVNNLDNEELLELAQRATRFLTRFRWCSQVKERFIAFDLGNKLGVFLFRIEPKLIGVDDTFWVIVGDVPPAYIVCDKAPDWRSALGAYVVEMRRWVEAVRAGQEIKGIIPVNAAPTLEHAEMLDSRLNFIEENLVNKSPDID